ncbi:hypothetical protein [Clostridioides difficile]|uniref:hypothetical protein n=1 Tax=Clostridioides difficile TaxID=1496 RepID=UPI000BB17BD3|nr:hypothetical protein [Clostridioides difficile]PBG42515.1 hypothetical protein BGU93_19245 [Clostridioides difficile]
MKIDYIRDFDKKDSIQQMIVLKNEFELLEYLKRENENFPDEGVKQGVEALGKASNFNDDVIIKGS